MKRSTQAFLTCLNAVVVTSVMFSGCPRMTYRVDTFFENFFACVMIVWTIGTLISLAYLGTLDED